jgi:hypothetical protein
MPIAHASQSSPRPCSSPWPPVVTRPPARRMFAAPTADVLKNQSYSGARATVRLPSVCEAGMKRRSFGSSSVRVRSRKYCLAPLPP